MTRYVICLIEYHEIGVFFNKLADDDNCSSYIFITSSPLAYIYLIRRKKKVLFVGPFSSSISDLVIQRERVLSVVLGYISEKKATRFVSGYIGYLLLLLGEIKEVGGSAYVFIWNGDSISGEAARYIQEREDVSLRYFEISNLPGKIFVDPQGVNKMSHLYKKPEILQSFPDCKMEYEEWKLGYLQREKSKKLRGFPLTLIFLEGLYCSTIGMRFFSIKKQLKNYLIAYTSLHSKKVSNTLPKKFALFPMQVRTDSQLVLNSRYTNASALAVALKMYDGNFVITPHPYDVGAVSEIKQSLKSECNRVHFTTESTLNLLSKAEVIYVNNSTIGLEAKILGCNVVILGDSLYKNINSSNIDKYIMSFLLNVDFYSSEVIDVHELEKIFQ